MNLDCFFLRNGQQRKRPTLKSFYKKQITKKTGDQNWLLKVQTLKKTTISNQKKDDRLIESFNKVLKTDNQN